LLSFDLSLFSFIQERRQVCKSTHPSSVVRSNEILGDLPDFGESIEVDDGELVDLTPGEGEEGEQGLVSTVGLRFGEILLGDMGDEVGGRGLRIQRKLTESGSVAKGRGKKEEMVSSSSSNNTWTSFRSIELSVCSLPGGKSKEDSH